MSPAGENQPSVTGTAPAVPFLAVMGLTAAELAVFAAGVDRATRVAALVGLLAAKVTIVLTFFMRAQASRRAARLTLAALAAAVGFAVVLMLEAAFRAGMS